jgi:putative copper resistance protein D
MSPEEDLEYSRFMHHSSGMALLLIGALLLIDRWTAHRHRLLRAGVGGAWLVLGIFLFVFSDLEAWPIGPVGFMESFSLPTAHEWIQHHLLAMITMVLGIYTMLSRWKDPKPVWRYLAAGIAVLGGVGLMIHQHLDHPGFDFVNTQHRLFALTSFFIAASLALEGSARFAWKATPYLLPAGLLLLGIQLALYVE